MAATKYQIFVSSTYIDLKDERDQVIKACLEMGHIPVGMEMFSAADEEQWKIITRQIDESDYYVVIIAHRYGSTVRGISYTEKEYNYAISKGIPTLGFIIRDSADWAVDRVETDNEALKRLKAFKTKVKKKPVDSWTNADELHSKCAIALMKAFNTQPRPGWIRTTEAVSTEVTEELSRLSSENAKLREELIRLKDANKTDAYAQGEDLITLRLDGGGRTLASIRLSWNKIFDIIAGLMIVGYSEEYVWHQLSDRLYLLEEIRNEGQSNQKGLVNGNDFNRIKTQLMFLGYITVDSSKPLKERLWRLTDFGVNVYGELHALRRTQYDNHSPVLSEQEN